MTILFIAILTAALCSGFFLAGKYAARNEIAEDSSKAGRTANEIDEDVQRMSDADVLDELHKRK